MFRIKIYWSVLAFCLLGSSSTAIAQLSGRRELIKDSILADVRIDTLQSRALRLLSEFSAGTSYGEIWIRDLNTFIKGSLKVNPKEEVKDKLLMFLKIQGPGGDIVDGVIERSKANNGYEYRYSELLPEWAAHKNTVETDQESSLLQAFQTYVEETGDKDVLSVRVGDKTVINRLEDALLYILNDRWSPKYGLVTGATTVDWGDVQPEGGWGVSVNEKTKWAIDVYDNAMYALAIDAFLKLKPEDYKARKDWNAVNLSLKKSVRKHLWDSSKQKYRPHIYLDGSPFSQKLDESKMLYSGGSICAILAGFNTKKEVAEINRQLLQAIASEKYATVGVTVFPPYPIEEFPNMAPYTYQNGGDWTWFGARISKALIRYGFPSEAYQELIPMIERVLANKGFYEWYDIRTGKPSGSGDFRGEAGVLYDATTALRLWAKEGKN